ncbi:hypothetical protein [Rurimicrobium arvi]
MKNLLTTVLLCASVPAFAQHADEFWKKHCMLKSSFGKGNTTQINIAYPCDWQEDKGKEKGLNIWTYEAGDQDILMESLMFTPFSEKAPRRTADQIVAKKTPNDPKNGQFLWSRKLLINGHDCAEVACKTKRSVLMLDMYIYTVQYIIPCKDGELSLGFTITASTEARAKELFNEYKTLFYNLANATEING